MTTKRTKRGTDMTGQLTIMFDTAPPAQAPSAPAQHNEPDAERRAEQIIQKYLRIWQKCSDWMDGAKYGTRLYKIARKASDNAESAYARMIHALKLETASFDELEQTRAREMGIAGNYQGRGCEGIRKEHEDNARIARRILDGFGYIQEEFDRQIRKSERYLEPGEQYDEDADGWENGRPIGYHYWLFEDAIARIPVPIVVINKYIEKYDKETN